MNIRTPIYIFFLLLYVKVGFGQVSFENRSILYNPDMLFYSGNCGAFADANGDGLDDLVIIDQAEKLFVGYNQGVGVPMEWKEGPKVSSSREYLCLLSDINNNGKREVITAGAYSRVKIFKQQSDGTYNFSQQIIRSILAQGGNTIDLDGDHLLDLFICSDDDENLIAMNNNGILTLDEDLIDWTTSPVSDNSGNYASEWADFNGDGLLDLSIAKCRLGVNETSDPRRINRLFVQQSDGTFIDEAKSRFLDIGWQSWTTSTLDYDNDGDLDVFISNHDFQHQLFSNDGNGYFTEVQYSESPISSFSFQSIIRDIDNNGYQDILIVGQGTNVLLLGTQEGLYDVVVSPLGKSVNSAIVGDINQDGKIDIMGIYSDGVNNPGDSPDQIFVNTTNNGNAYLDIQLIGTVSNKDAVGALVKVYSNLGIQTQVVQSGESYGITNSYTRHFGLGVNPLIDSIIIQWPSGIRDKIIPKSINTTYVIEEGSCFKENVTIVDSIIYLCEDTIEIIGPSGFTNYQWSTGDTLPILNISATGVYVLSYIDNGCKVRSNPIIVQNGKIDGPLFSEFLNTTACLGASIKLNAPNASSFINWSSSEQGFSIEVDSTSTIKLEVIDQCGFSLTDSVQINIADPTIKVFQGDTVATGENAQLFAEGEAIRWYVSETSPSQIYEGDTLNLFNVDESRAYYAEQEIETFTQKYLGGLLIDQATLQSDTSNYGLLIFTNEVAFLESAMVYATVSGEREFVIEENGLNVFKMIFNLTEGWNLIDFGLKLSANQLYKLSTTSSLNISNFGTPGPNLVLNDNQFNYPYLIGNTCEIIGESNGNQVYPYFYNIQIGANPITCKSNRQAVWVYLDTDVATAEIDNDHRIKIYPNPTFNEVFIKSADDLSLLKYELYNSQGKVLLSGNCHNYLTTLHLNDLNSGLYFIKIDDGVSFIIKKIIKI